ncbi:MAG: tetratricopeptide repeat protein [Cyanobacteriota/Melainabacteria group bacterium]
MNGFRHRLLEPLPYLYRLGDFNKAVDDATRAIALNPDSAKGYLNRGHAYRELKEYEKALADIDQALKMHKGLAPAYYNRSRIYEAMANADMEKAKNWASSSKSNAADDDKDDDE